MTKFIRIHNYRTKFLNTRYPNSCRPYTCIGYRLYIWPFLKERQKLEMERAQYQSSSSTFGSSTSTGTELEMREIFDRNLTKCFDRNFGFLTKKICKLWKLRISIVWFNIRVVFWIRVSIFFGCFNRPVNFWLIGPITTTTRWDTFVGHARLLYAATNCTDEKWTVWKQPVSKKKHNF